MQFVNRRLKGGYIHVQYNDTIRIWISGSQFFRLKIIFNSKLVSVNTKYITFSLSQFLFVL